MSGELTKQLQRNLKAMNEKEQSKRSAGSELAAPVGSVDELTNHLNAAMDVAAALRDRRITGGKEWTELTNVMWNISMAKLHAPNEKLRHGAGE